MSEFNWQSFDLYNPSPEHKMLREMVAEFTQSEVESQALEYDRDEKFNLPLFRKLGELGLLGITVPEKFGGSEQDAVAAVIAHEELSASDPGFLFSLFSALNVVRKQYCFEFFRGTMSKIGCQSYVVVSGLVVWLCRNPM